MRYMGIGNIRWAAGKAVFLGALFGIALGANAQAPVMTHLKKILVLDKSQFGASGHLESRRDLNAALKELAAEKGFTITFIGQNDPASRIASEFSPANLAAYQAVIFSSNDGVDAQIDAISKTNFENYVKAGGGFVPIHAASAFISNWPWLTSVLVQSFFGPAGSNQPTFNIVHDEEGAKEGTETKGIFKDLIAPAAFLDECYSFRASPRGREGVTILLTVDEKSFSRPVEGPMGADHPVAWSKTEGKGRVAHISQGHSWSTSNVYTEKNSYLKKFVYGALRYAVGDFLGCMDNRYIEYNADATRNDADACKTMNISGIVRPDGSDAAPLIAREAGKQLVTVIVRGSGPHLVTLMDVSGRVVQSKRGTGPEQYSLPVPAQSGIYHVVAQSAGKSAHTTRFRVTVL
jgi:type 1 glutamine amidotransferase